MGTPEEKSSTGLEPKLAGLLCYVLGWVTGLVFYLVEKDSKFVRFHAMQSIVTFGAISVIYLLLSIVVTPFVFTGLWALWTLIYTLLGIGTLILWILLMIRAYQGTMYKLPWAGDLAERYTLISSPNS